jgi:hypothetical protein
MSLDSYYSSSPDTEPPGIDHVDGLFHEGSGIGDLKVESSDSSGVIRVVVAYTHGQGAWYSKDLSYQDAMLKWTGTISATAGTRYFVQVVDGAGNVAVDDNKGQYHELSPAVRSIDESSRIYLPLILKGG